MKYPIPIAVATLVIAASYAAFAASSLDRPPGVEEAKWVAINERLGLVLEQDGGLVDVPKDLTNLAPLPRNDRALKMITPATGYLMVKTSAGWSRLHLAEQSTTFPK